jgi:transposase-like protein
MVELPANLEMFSLADVARIFGVNKKTVFQWKKPLKPGEQRVVLEFAKAGGKNVTTRRNIQAFLRQPIEAEQQQTVVNDYEKEMKLINSF